MPNPNQFQNLVNEVRNNMGTVTNSASASLDQNSYIDEAQVAYDAALANILKEEARPGAVENLGRSALSGASTGTGFVASLPSLVNALDLTNISDEEHAAFARRSTQKEGQLYGGATDTLEAEALKVKDDAILNQTVPFLQQELFGEKAFGERTVGDRIAEAYKAQGNVRDINKFFDISEIVDQTNREELSKDIGKSFDDGAALIMAGKDLYTSGDVIGGAATIADGAADLLFNGAYDLASNPLAVTEYVAENLPQLAVGLLGKTGKAALAAFNLGYAGDIYADGVEELKNQNEPITRAKLNEVAAWSASAALAEQIGDLATLKVLKKSGKVSDSIKNKVATGIASVIGTAAKEGATEGYQTAVEENLSKLDDELSWKKIYEGALIGSAAGGTIATAGALAAPSADKIVNSVIENQESIANKEAIDTAVETGDATNLEGIDKVQALARINEQEDISPEQREANLQEIDAVYEGYEAERNNLIDELDVLETKMDDGTITDEEINTYENLSGEFNRVNDLLNNVDQFQTSATSDSTQLNEDIKLASEGNVEAAQRSFGSYQLNPRKYTNEQVKQLLETSTGLDENQTASLEVDLEARDLINKASSEEVSQNILVGNANTRKKGERLFLGIQNYSDMIGSAIAKGNTTTVGNLMDSLRGFAVHEQTKATALKTAAKSILNREPVSKEVRDVLAPMGITKFGGGIIKLSKQVNKEAALLNDFTTLMENKVNIPVEVTQQPVASEQVAQPVTEPVTEPVEETTEQVVTEQVDTTPASTTTPATTEVGRVVNYKGTPYVVVRQDDRGTQVLDPATGNKLQLKSDNPALQPTASKLKEVTHKGKQYLVSPSGTIVSQSTGRVMKWDAKNGDRKAILNTANETVPVVTQEVTQDADVDLPPVDSYQDLDTTSELDTDYSNPDFDVYADIDTTIQERDTSYSFADELLNQPNDPDAELSLQNLLVTGFAKGNGDSLLDNTANLIETLRNNPGIINERIENESERVSARLALDTFLAFYDKLAPTLDTMFKAKSEKFRFEDFLQFTAIDGQLPANVKAAIAIGAYDWITVNASKTTYNTNEDIAAIMNINPADVDTLPYDLVNQLRSGFQMSTAVGSMGQAGVSALNLRAKKTAGDNYQTALENSLGAAAFSALDYIGWFDNRVDFISSEEIANLMGDDPNQVQDRPNVRLVKLSRTPERMHPEMRQLIDAGKVYSAFTTKMFAATTAPKMPSLSPPKIASRVKNSFMKVPETTKKILTKASQWKYGFNNAFNDFELFDKTSQLSMVGYKHDVEAEMLYKQEGLNVANKALEREVDILMDFRTEAQDKPFFLPWVVWKNQRMGYDSGINPQTSKIHRFLVGPKRFKTKVDPNNEVQMNRYALTVAGGFGFTAEKVTEQQALEAYKLWYADNKTVISNGVAALIQLRKGIGDKEANQLAVTTAVELGGHAMHTFQSLSAMANRREAGKNTFTHEMIREIDGITNGVNITNLQLPDNRIEKYVDKVRSQGMYMDDTSGHAEWKASEGSNDSYEQIGNLWDRLVQETSGHSPELLNAFSKIVGKIGRDMSKAPLMTTIYGAQIKGVMNGASNAGIDNFYDQFESMLKANDEQGLYDLLDAMVTVTSGRFKYQKRAVVNGDLFQTWKDFELTDNDLVAFRDSFEYVYQSSLERTLNELYGDFFIKRDKLNAQLNIASAVAIETFNRSVAAKVEERRAAGTWDDKISVLSTEELQSVYRTLADRMPIIKTLMSGNDLESGLNVLKSTRKTNDSPQYTVAANYNLPSRNNPKKKMSRKFQGKSLSFELPGIGGIPVITQSLDATNIIRTVMASVMSKQPMVNVHDAVIGPDSYIYELGQKINKSHYENMIQFDMSSAVSDLFTRTMSAATPEVLKKLEGDKKFNRFFMSMGVADTSSFINDRGETITYVTKVHKDAIKTMERIAVEDAATNKKLKDAYLKKFTTVGQYYLGANTTFKTANYEVSTAQEAFSDDVNAMSDTATNHPRTRGEVARTLGSASDANIDDKYAFEDALEINKESTMEIFDRLGNLESNKVDSAKHKTTLESLLGSVISRVITPVNLYLNKAVGEETKGMITGTDMYIVNQDVNVPQSGISARVAMSPQEVYVHELVHSIAGMIDDPSAKGRSSRKALNKLWEQAKANIKPSDLAEDPNNAEDMLAAQERWDHMFTPKSVDGRSPHLHEFLAFGLTNEPMRELLVNLTPPLVRDSWIDGENLLERMATFLSRLIDFINNRFVIGSQGSIDKQLDALIRHITSVEGNNRGLVISGMNKMFAPLSTLGNKTATTVQEAVSKALQSKYVEGSKSGIVYFGGAVARLAVDTAFAKQVGNWLGDKTSSFMNQTDNALNNEIRDLVVAAKGRTERVGRFHDIKRMANSAIDRARRGKQAAIVKHIEDAFDPSNPMTKETKKALSYALLKTDFSVLVDTFGANDAARILTDAAFRNQMIKEYRGQIKDKDMLMQSMNLGYFMVTGKSKIFNASLNAYNISRKAGLGKSIPADAKKMEPLIDVLASLYAVNNIPTAYRQAASDVITHEQGRSEANGYTALMYLHSELRKKSKERLFKDNPELMIKGYIADRLDPNVSVKTATGDTVTTHEMAKQGYAKGPQLPIDPTDPTKQPMYLYVNKQGGMQTYLAGMTYLMSNKAKGTNLQSLYLNAGNSWSRKELATNLLDASVAAGNLYSKQLNDQSLPDNGAVMIPVFNAEGIIVDYRYIMNDALKDNLLGRDMDFDKILGVMAGDIEVKPKIEESNIKLVGALYENFKMDFNTNSDAYVTIGPRSSNAKHRDIWRMLPYEMKEEIKTKWGREHLIIRNDDVTLLFGYRKHSAANKWDRPVEDRSLYEAAYIWVAEKFFGRKAAMRVKQAENVLQELVRLGKDTIVIKSFVVTVANTISNLFLLGAMGINPVTAMKDYTVAYRSAQVYKRDLAKMEGLQLRLTNPNLGAEETKRINGEIARLQEELAANPVKDLIRQGVLQNIVEDVNIGDDDFTIKRTLIDSAAKKFGLANVAKNTPSWLKSVGSNALVLQGSGLYSVLQEMAQLSDFGARYSLVKHLQKKGVTQQEAVGKAMHIFIDYDLPDGVGMQYANDMGLVMFSKYFVRVQKVIWETFRDHPAGVISTLMFQSYFDFGTNIHESVWPYSSVTDRLATPLDTLAMMDETVTLNTVSSLM